jgi:diguanylate cyclase (GGDEF)-like protein/PAS domain S-box-containing protein
VEEELRASEERLREAQRLAHVGSWDWDLRRNEVRCSDEIFRIAGRAPLAAAVTIDFLVGLLHHADRARWRAVLQEAATRCQGAVDEARVVCPDGTERLVEARVEAFCTPEGAAYARGTWLDITERKRAQEQRERERQFRTLAENSTDIIVRLDRRLRPMYVNPAIESILGHEAADELRRSDGEAPLPPMLSGMRRQLQQVLATGQPLAAMATVPTPRGERYLDSRVVPEFGSDGTVESLLVVDRDITEIKRAQQALEELTLVDPLTGIPNRRHLDKVVAQEWRREARHGHEVALLMIDIDHFKAFNDTYGHQHGDECLRQVAQILRRTLHRPADTPARYGGEEFVVFLPETGLAAAYKLAERLRQAVSDLRVPHTSSPVADRLTISLGVAALKANEARFQDLVAAADRALYRAKRLGRNRSERDADPPLKGNA